MVAFVSSRMLSFRERKKDFSIVTDKQSASLHIVLLKGYIRLSKVCEEKSERCETVCSSFIAYLLFLLHCSHKHQIKRESCLSISAKTGRGRSLRDNCQSFKCSIKFQILRSS